MILETTKQGQNPLHLALCQISLLLNQYPNETGYTLLAVLDSEINSLVQICLQLIRYDIDCLKKNKALRPKTFDAYNSEIEPETTLLWKCLQLNEVQVFKELLEPVPVLNRALCDVNQQTAKTKSSLLMLLLQEDLKKKRSPGILTLNVKLELLKEVLKYDVNLGLKNSKGRDVFQIAKKFNSAVFNCQDLIAEKGRIQGVLSKRNSRETKVIKWDDNNEAETIE